MLNLARLTTRRTAVLGTHDRKLAVIADPKYRSRTGRKEVNTMTPIIEPLSWGGERDRDWDRDRWCRDHRDRWDKWDRWRKDRRWDWK